MDSPTFPAGCLKQNNIGVAAPILDKTGNAIQQFQAAEGIRNGVSFEYAEGKVIIQPNDKQLHLLRLNGP